MCLSGGWEAECRPGSSALCPGPLQGLPVQSHCSKSGRVTSLLSRRLTPPDCLLAHTSPSLPPFLQPAIPTQSAPSFTQVPQAPQMPSGASLPISDTKALP